MEPQSVYFRDGARRIDLVLAYEEEDGDFTKEQRRKGFLRSILAEGLETEMATDKWAAKATRQFIKIHAPWAVVTKHAEIEGLKAPIKVKEKSNTEEGDRWKSSANQEPAFYTAPFTRQQEKSFLIEDRDTFFNSAQRSQIVWQILTRVRTPWGNITRLLKDDTFTAAFPLHDGAYDKDPENGAAINDRRVLYLEWAHPSNWRRPQPLWLIRRYFGDKVALYFAWLGYYTTMLVPASIVGVLCFLFGALTLGTDYNAPSSEICDATVGGRLVMCPLCGHCRIWTLDDSCTFSKLTYFFDNPATPFFAVFMAFWTTAFLEFWKRKQALLSWQWDLEGYEANEQLRPEFEAAVTTWRVNQVTGQAEPFVSLWSKAVRMAVVSSLVALLLSLVAVVLFGIIVYRLVMVSVLYATGGSMGPGAAAGEKYEFLRDNSKIIASVSAAMLNLVVVEFLHDRVYVTAAMWLTDSEFPRTQTEYEQSFTFKMFLFEFINYYSVLIYVAFFKGRFFRHPGDDSDNALEKLRGDMCDPAGCLSELCIQLATIMIGKQGLNNFMEFFAPKVGNWFRRRRLKTTKAGPSVGIEEEVPAFLTRWEEDYNLEGVDQLALFDEYLEMVIQYGFVTLFVAAFPLAPLFALLNNVIELRLDAYKWTTLLRRPVAERVGGLGAWYGILQGITYTAVVTNAFVIAITSDLIPRLVYKWGSHSASLRGYINSSLSIYPTEGYNLEQRTLEGMEYEYCRYRGYYNPPDHPEAPLQASDRYWQILAARLAFVAIFEHLAFGLTGLLAFAIPDIPEEQNVEIQKEKMVANEILYENHSHSSTGETHESEPVGRV